MSFVPSRIFHTLKLVGLEPTVVLVVLLALPSVGLHAFQDRIVEIVETSSNFTAEIFFLDPRNGWAVCGVEKGAGSIIVATEDGGKTWRKRGTQVGFYSRKLFFLDRLRGWSVAISKDPVYRNPNGEWYDDFLLSTADGGKTWMKLAKIGNARVPEAEGSVTDLLFVDKQHGWIVGSGQSDTPAFLETLDGGMSFSKVNIHWRDAGDLRRILGDSDGSILIVGNRTIVASNDRGKTWQVQASREKPVGGHWAEGLSSGWVFPDGHWLAVGAAGGALVLSTSDYGNHWDVVAHLWSAVVDQSHPQNALNDVSFSDANHGCAVGDSTTPVCTSDGGKTWMEGDALPAPKRSTDSPYWRPNAYMRIVLLPNGMGWVTADGGFLYQTTDGGHTWAAFDLVKSAS